MWNAVKNHKIVTVKGNNAFNPTLYIKQYIQKKIDDEFIYLLIKEKLTNN